MNRSKWLSSLKPKNLVTLTCLKSKTKINTLIDRIDAENIHLLNNIIVTKATGKSENNEYIIDSTK